jgi:CubicO group peptidase (beta-lactamase class C family)
MKPAAAASPALPSSNPAAAAWSRRSTDYLAFGRMMLDKGKYGSERILSRPSVELMTTDQITPEQKAAPD